MHMKRTLIVTLIFLTFSVAARAQAARPSSLAKKVEKAYMNDLSSLDGKRRMRSRLRVVVENSLSGDLETHYFKSFRSAEKWLKKGERKDGTPFRATGALGSCNNARCIFSYDSGILHNHLYLKKVTFSYSSGRRYIREIRLLDGA